MQGEHGASLERKLSVEVSEIRDAAKGLESIDNRASGNPQYSKQYDTKNWLY